MAKANLNTRTVDALQATGERFDVFDAKTRGFHVRVQPNGAKVYRLKYSFAGAQRAVTIGEHGQPWTADAARKRAEVLRGMIRDGIDPMEERATQARQAAEERRRALTVAQLVERWLADGRAAAPNKRESSWAHDASRLRRHIVPLLGTIPAASLRRADIEQAQAEIAAGKTAVDERSGKKRGRARVRGGKSIARGAIVSLSSAYGWAVAQELVTENPVSKVTKLDATKRERFLTEQETGRLLDAIATQQETRQLRDDFADALRLLLLTGARHREVMELAWSEVRFERGVIELPTARSKTGAKTIPLNAPAAAILAARKRKGRYVFPSPTDAKRPAGGLQKAWEQVREAAKLRDVRIHDLRHSYASFAVAGGASLPLIGKALGHKQVATTQRYSHLGDDPVREMSERVGAKIMGTLTAHRSRDAAANVTPIRKKRS